MSEPISERVELCGAEQDLLRAGDGDELVVFLHAVGGDRTSWEAELRSAPPRYTAVSVDFRGHGKAKRPPLESVGMEQLADDVAALVEHLGFACAHLVGLSMGGVVAQLVHARHPARVASLTLASTWAHYGEEAARARSDYIEDRLRRLPMLEGSREDMAFLLAPGTPAEAIERAAQIEGTKDREVFLRSWRAMFAVDLRPGLARIDVPLLVVGAERDPITPVDPYLSAIAHAVPGSRLVTIEGAGHFVNLDRPVAFQRELWTFLARHPAPLGRIARGPVPERRVAAETTAHALLRLVADRGVDVLFSNSGTDYVDVIDALARWEDDPEFRLKVVASPHENTAIAMAHGYFLATGRPQAVMAHVNVGSANMTMGIINAFRARIPMLVMAGRTPHYDSGMPGCRVNFVQWGQDTRDQASFREFLKWDYQLEDAHALETVVDRALAIAESDPAGPVYLMLPGEVMARPIENGFSYAASPRQRPARAGSPDSRAVEEAARAIAGAERPLLVTAELGRYEGGLAALARLADVAAIPVVEFGKHNFMNLPTSHPMHHGFDPVPAVRDADLVIAVESHVPWIPVFAGMARAPRVVQIGVDPLSEKLPMRAFPSDVTLAGNPRDALRALVDRLPRHLDADRTAERRARLAREHEAIFEAARREADIDASRERITKRFLSRVLGKIVDRDTLIFNEYDLDPTLVPREEAGGWFENSIASGLGWALGAALGAKLALPDKTVLATVGDGAYLFNVPLSAHHVAWAEKLPILIVVFDDQGWSTIKRSYRGAKPDGWAAKSGRYALCDFEVGIDYAKVAEASGGIGLRAEKPAELEAVLTEAIRLVRTGDRHVLVDVICEKDD
jgi:acetolactate synthase-1/2/3 large subunit